MKYTDRQAFENLYRAHNRAYFLTGAASLWIAVELSMRVPRVSQMAVGWKILSCLGMATALHCGLTAYVSRNYGPLMGAYMRKYKDCSKNDPFEITDRTREFYQIDDSQYMNYTMEDLKHQHMHVNHGPQPDGSVLDSTYLAEVDKFL